MIPVITAKSILTVKEVDEALLTLGTSLDEVRFVHDMERLTVACIGILMNKASVPFPVGNDNIFLYIGIDDAIEDIKDEYLYGILNEGLIGARPLLFPFTSPNAIAARVSILFDLRGECITMPVKYSCRDVIKYSVECLQQGYTKRAIAGGILSDAKQYEEGKGLYRAEFYFLEDLRSARSRGIRIEEKCSGLDDL